MSGYDGDGPPGSGYPRPPAYPLPPPYPITPAYPPADSPPYSPDYSRSYSPPVRSRPPRRRRRTVWRVAVAATVLVLAGGVSTAAVGYLRIATPGQVVDSYFDALRSGDAATALRYGRTPRGDLRYLTASVLRVQQRMGPIGPLTVGAIDEHGDSATVAVSYPLDRPDAATTSSAKITLHRAARHWLIDTTAALVRIDVGNGSRRATLAGLTLPDQEVALFPGAAPITYDSTLLEQDPASDAIALSSTGTLSVRARLSDTGRQRMTDSVSAAMRTCLTQAQGAPATCPLTPAVERVVPGSLRGAVAGFDVSGRPDLVSDDADGLIEVTGSFRVTGRWSTLDFNNLPVARSGLATVAVRARLYVAAPTTVSWQKP